MKGKGKAPQDKDKDRDIKDCPLQFPDLNTVDHNKDCIKYAQVVSREEGGHISLEELDQLQADIEILLASVGKRLRQLGSENNILASWPEKKDGKKSVGKGPETPSRSSTPTKRKGTPTDERERSSSKKFKDSNGRPSQPSTPTSGPRSKGKNSQSKGQSEDPTGSDTSISETPKVPKNDAVNRFWLSVEPFCAPISTDDLRVIEEMLKAHEDEVEYMKIPPLGVHYTQRWAEEDLLEEQSDGSRITEKKKSSVHASNGVNGTTNSDAATLLKKAEYKKYDYFMDDSPFGPLTQRLISALIEDNLMTPIDDSMTDTAECADEAPAISPRMLAKQLNIGNPATLERRIRKELEEQGILEKEAEEEDDPNDEILAELRKKQQELRAISQQNVNILKSLYRQGQEDMARQDLKKKLQAVDADVMDAYRKIQIARQKKKSPTKKEKETIMKVLKDREALIKALEL
ncbi:transcriptional adapter 3-A-like [Biomphalaria glabrata]|uniref:Transcriptional adapter 3-A-like n=1 Tax=Biomphalaria glabrata TaxID=6526 RepID=A0A9U8EF48_BIOGL|nr:transcriptional adapter 3-A-like [Biomphalaria glabrata]